MRGLPAAILGIVVTVVALVGVAIADPTSPQPVTSPAPPVAEEPANSGSPAIPRKNQVQKVSPAHEAKVKAFRRGRRSSDSMPEQARRNIERHGMFGENPGLSRKVLTLPSGHALYLVPGADNLVGVYDEVGGGGVTDLAHINSGQSWGVDICAPNLKQGWVRFNGELPDDATTVVLTTLDGTKLTPALGENVWALEVPASPAAKLPTRLEFTSGGIQRVVAIEPPSDIAGTECHGPPAP